MKFNMSDAWRDATAMMSGNREVLLVVAGLFFFLPSVLMNFAMGDQRSIAMASAEQAEGAVAAVYAQWWWLFVLISVVSLVGSLALLALLRDHHRPTVGEAIKVGLAGLLPAIGAYLLLTFGAFLILLLTFAILGQGLAVGGTSPPAGQIVLIAIVAFALMVYPAVRLSLATPVIAIDKVRNPFTVLARSWRVTGGNGMRLLLFYFLLGVVYLVLSLVVAIVVGVLGLVTGEGAGLIVNALISGALTAVASVVTVAVIAAAHRQLGGASPEAASQMIE